MRVLIAGASGLVGTELVRSLQENHQVFTLVRRQAERENERSWAPAEGKLDAAALEGMDAVINLSGQNIADKRWSPKIKELILKSRLETTSLLVKRMGECATAPSVFLSASAIGYYGDRGDEVCTEESDPGSDFLSDVCRQWEQCAEEASALSRVCVMRLGAVMSPAGGALGETLLPFKLGLGGRLGSGRQYLSWVSIDDLCGAVEFLLVNSSCRGAFNVVSPNPVTNLEFTRALGSVLHRPTFFPVPALVLRAALGELSDALLLSSTRVLPQKLVASGFDFEHPEIREALRSLLI